MIFSLLPLIKFLHSLSVDVSHLDSVAELVGDMPDLLQRITNVAVALEKVEDRLPEDLEGEAHVAVVVEGVEHADTEMLARWILAVEFLQDVDLQLGGLSVLVNVLDDLHGHVTVRVVVPHFHNLSKGSLSQSGHDLVPLTHEVPGQVGQVTVAVVRDGPLPGRHRAGRTVEGERAGGRAVGGRGAVGGGPRGAV